MFDRKCTLYSVVQMLRIYSYPKTNVSQFNLALLTQSFKNRCRPILLLTVGQG